MTIIPDYLLSQREYDILWSDMDRGSSPYPLQVPTQGTADWHTTRMQVYASLRGKGLFNKQLDTGLEGLFRVLANPRVKVDVLGYTDRPLRAVASADDHAAVLAVLSDEGLALSAIRPTALAEEIVGLLPDTEAGIARSTALLYGDMLRSIGEDLGDTDPFSFVSEAEALLQAGLSTADIGSVLRLAEGQHSAGQVSVSATEGHHSRMRTSSTLIAWFDNRFGRYLMVRNADWLSVVPTAGPQVVRCINEVLAEELG